MSVTTSEPRVLRHSVLNLVGMGLPLVAAIFTIPMLIHGLGQARFGILTLIWALVSYFGLFDFGLGRALTLHLASAIAKDGGKDSGVIIGSASVALGVLGLLASLIMWTLSDRGVDLISAVPDRSEVVRAIGWMTLAMPAIVLTSGYRGILEALHRFDLVNLLRVPMGLFTFIGPVVVLLLGYDRLDDIAAVLTIGRIIACVAHYLLARRQYPKNVKWTAIDVSRIRPLLVSGGWMTISNVVSPVMGYADRFIVGSVIGAAAVASVVTPQELVTKLWIVPISLTSALFPAMVKQFVSGGEKARRSFEGAISVTYLVVLIPSGAAAIFAHEILSIWISPVFARGSATLLQIYAFGTFINCLAHTPFTALQSAGRARTTAVVHMCELPIYLLALYLLGSRFGTIGVAWGWTARMILDTLAMFGLCLRANRWNLGSGPGAHLLERTLLAMAVFGLAFVDPLAGRLIGIIAASGIVAWWSYRAYFARAEPDASEPQLGIVR